MIKATEWVYAIGLMSGTSLDGVDLAYCRFKQSERKWAYEILQAETYSYPKEILDLLKSMLGLSGRNLEQASRELGAYYGVLCRKFIDEYHLKPDFIASHGHTIFHNPQEGYTYQAGSGDEIAAKTGVLCVSDFRTPDVAKGGQGAPLVPIGDELLFSEYDAVLNLGGFSNISFKKDYRRIGFDICPVNMALNHFAAKLGYSFDVDGEIARSGKLHDDLLTSLNSWDYYKTSPPKSLAREDFEQEFMPIINMYPSLSVSDILRTLSEHIAIQIAASSSRFSSLLITGGGIKNRFLRDLLHEKLGSAVHVPPEILIDFKEAMVFAFMGLLRLRNEINILSEVTGASSDTSSGIISQV